MMLIDIVLPAMGEGIVDATITKWLVSVGDMVTEDQSIVEIATDKVDSEIPAPAAGRVKEFLFKEGEVPKVGQTIVIIEVETDKQAQVQSPSAETLRREDTHATAIKKEEAGSRSVEKPIPTADKKQPVISPLVRTIVKQEGIPDDELRQVKGTGLQGRITRDDILAYVGKRSKFIDKPKATVEDRGADASPAVEVVHMDRMRKLIAEHMVMSKQTSAHVTSFIEADVTNLVAWRNANKDSFLQREGHKLTLTPMFVEAAVKAIRQFPMINSSVDGDKILVKRNINIGIATALPNGNLIVPVVKDADKLNLAGLSAKVNQLAQRARENKLQPDEIQGGTFTITNLGMFETLTGTPIINQPQVAILAVGSITKRVVVIESDSGDSIGIRHMTMLSLSYDHRVIDGALGGMFLKVVRDNLQNFAP
ncbi:MAG TPA: dihydrolipoamide acetyltransferase family protein [Tenuifilaceae bacterium]|nr:dihydrolipoamide acetyltransferase family protein [Tenuifilaceae bacterium]HQC65790.1 dihydrolipoamide acetyltransferase family protein [Tenuifilaceae bacterium]